MNHHGIYPAMVCTPYLQVHGKLPCVQHQGLSRFEIQLVEQAVIQADLLERLPEILVRLDSIQDIGNQGEFYLPTIGMLSPCASVHPSLGDGVLTFRGAGRVSLGVWGRACVPVLTRGEGTSGGLGTYTDRGVGWLEVVT
ncbi:hypothetical protein Tco_0005451 [Tanacetum coccineum]